MLEQTLDRFNRLDILINNAQVEPTAAILTMDEWDWDRTVAVNLKAPFLMMQSAARIMQDQGGGSIVNIGVTGIQGDHLAQKAAYAATKSALGVLTQAAALELAALNIRVNMIAVGRYRGATAKVRPDEGDLSLWQAAADAALYLSSSDAKFITGETLSVHGPIKDR
jgi:NAD(P)-dependent dehydrogenase (short-subunit alcohol dehydrogenase family)